MPMPASARFGWPRPARCCGAALQKMARAPPPGMSGTDATRRIIHASPHIGVIMLTMADDEDSVFAAMRAGARGYILKGSDKAEVLRTLEAVSRGEALFGPAIARRLVSFFGAL